MKLIPENCKSDLENSILRRLCLVSQQIFPCPISLSAQWDVKDILIISSQLVSNTTPSWDAFQEGNLNSALKKFASILLAVMQRTLKDIDALMQLFYGQIQGELFHISLLSDYW